MYFFLDPGPIPCSPDPEFMFVPLFHSCFTYKTEKDVTFFYSYSQYILKNK